MSAPVAYAAVPEPFFCHFSNQLSRDLTSIPLFLLIFIIKTPLNRLIIAIFFRRIPVGCFLIYIMVYIYYTYDNIHLLFIYEALLYRTDVSGKSGSPAITYTSSSK